jgi:hypothetical protein
VCTRRDGQSRTAGQAAPASHVPCEASRKGARDTWGGSVSKDLQTYRRVPCLRGSNFNIFYFSLK